MKCVWRIFKRKLADESGDSLAESLVAILIAALATVLLATMVMAATNVSAKSQNVLRNAYGEESTVASGIYGDDKSGFVTISIPGENGSRSIKVTIYSSNKSGNVNNFVRYEYDPSTQPEES